jgi:GT2 family glycosyltransferase
MLVRRIVRLFLPRKPGGVASFAGPVPAGTPGGWYLLAIRGRRQRETWIATLRLGGADDTSSPQEVALVRPSGWNVFGVKVGVVFLRDGVSQLTARLYGARHTPVALRVGLLPVPRGIAAVGVCLLNFGTFRASLQAVSGTRAERLRKAVAAAGLRGQQLPRSYANWLMLFDSWSEERLAKIDSSLSTGRPRISALVLHAGAATPALAATLASLHEQFYPASLVAVAGPGEMAEVSRAAAAGDHVAVLQAGEILPRHGLLLLAHNLVRHGDPGILIADEDVVTADGVRSDPLFKPEPNLLLMCSGMLSRGVWLIRSMLLQAPERSATLMWAECIRLDAWFRAHEAGRADETRRVPHLLTHRRTDAENAPATALALVVSRHLGDAGLHAQVTPNFPLRLQWEAGILRNCKVSILVPSRLRGDIQLACLLDVLAKTTHSNFELVVVVTQDAALDSAQERAVERLRADPRARVEHLRRASFNYSLANNFAASATQGEFICLLNDDVSTLEGDWLDRMVAFFSDPHTGIVGAKLYYPNLTVQHGGVIMGLAGLAEHVNRFLPRGDPGYAWRGELDQELSAVTGACLLVRRSTYESVGGMDESFPTAFNDVDFCLRVREQGHSVVFAASVELVHHETLSFGHHYRHNIAQEAVDVRRMRERWPAVCQADPFHNPNLSLVGQSEWELAYPPRNDDDGADASPLLMARPGS